MKHKAFTLIELLVCVVIVAIIASMLFGSVGSCGIGKNYSNGSRVGVVTKFSQKGMWRKSWEGELLVALPAGIASATQPEKFEFNADPAAVDRVNEAMRSGRRVELVYRQWWSKPYGIDNNQLVASAADGDEGRVKQPGHKGETTHGK